MPPPALQDYRKLGVIGREDIAAATVLVSMAQRQSEEQPDLLAWIGFCLALRPLRASLESTLYLVQLSH